MFGRRKKGKADLAAARKQRAVSERLAAEARHLAGEIREIRRENHFADAITATIRRNK